MTKALPGYRALIDDKGIVLLDLQYAHAKAAGLGPYGEHGQTPAQFDQAWEDERWRNSMKLVDLALKSLETMELWLIQHNTPIEIVVWPQYSNKRHSLEAGKVIQPYIPPDVKIDNDHGEPIFVKKSELDNVIKSIIPVSMPTVLSVSDRALREWLREQEGAMRGKSYNSVATAAKKNFHPIKYGRKRLFKILTELGWPKGTAGAPKRIEPR